MSHQITTGSAVDSAAACVEFWDAAAEKGWFNSASARAVRTAFGKVMEIDENWRASNLRDLDLEEQFSRFRTLKRNEYSDASLKVYRTRFIMAVKTYLARNDDDPDWKTYGPSARGTGSSNPKPKKPTKGSPRPASVTEPANPKDSAPRPSVQVAAPAAVAGNTITHVFPLRDDLDVQLVLPRDLTKDEAEWLGTLLMTLPRPSRAT